MERIKRLSKELESITTDLKDLTKDTTLRAIRIFDTTCLNWTFCDFVWLYYFTANTTQLYIEINILVIWFQRNEIVVERTFNYFEWAILWLRNFDWKFFFKFFRIVYNGNNDFEPGAGSC